MTYLYSSDIIIGMMNIKLKKGCEVEVWSGRTEQIQYWREGTVWVDVKDFDEECYVMECVEGPTYYIPKKNCVVL